MNVQRRTILVAIIALALSIALPFLYIGWHEKPLDYDSRTWQTAPRGSVVRYKMADNLARKIRNEQWNLERTLKELGMPDESTLAKPARNWIFLEYELGHKPIAVVRERYYLHLRFLPDKSLLDIDISRE